MLLMNKFARIYSQVYCIFIMLMFRLLLYGGQAYSKEAYARNEEPNWSMSNNRQNAAVIFIAVVYPKSKETVFSKIIKQTVTSMSEEFQSATNLRVVPHYTAISDTGGFNVEDIEEVCTSWNNKPIIVALVFAQFKSGFGHVLTALHNNIPVLWATGEVRPGYFDRVPLSPYEVSLDPGSYEVLRSLRSLLLAAHWHSFTVMHTTTLLASRRYKKIINQKPLLPTILQFRADSTSYYIFRLLSDISKSTKGVIVLICEATDAKRVLEESRKLNMVDGDFVWLWIDTNALFLSDKTVKIEKFRDAPTLDRKVRHAPKFENQEQNLIISCNGCKDDNKTDIIINSNKILPFRTDTINQLIKHHFPIYRKKPRNKLKADIDKQKFENGSHHEPDRLANDLFPIENLKLSRNDSEYVARVNAIPDVDHGPILLPFDNSIIYKNDTYTSNDVVKRTIEYPVLRVPTFLENTSFPVRRNTTVPAMPVGILALQVMPLKIDKNYVRSTLRLVINTIKDVIVRIEETKLSKLLNLPRMSCFDFYNTQPTSNSITEELREKLKKTVKDAVAGKIKFNESTLEPPWNSSLASRFKILNLISEENKAVNESRRWKTIGHINGEENVYLETIVWPGGDIIPVSTGRGSRSIFRIVTAFSPPFVMIGELDEDGQCLRGLECHQFLSTNKDNLTLLFNEMERTEEESEVNVLDRLQKSTWDEMDILDHHPGQKFKTNCCYGLSMDLLENVAEELEFDFQLYIASDELFGSKIVTDTGEAKWNGIVGDLVSGTAHMSFAALSVSSSRAQVIDFSVPYFFSGVSFLAAPKESSDIPLFAFLLPFSPYLWIAIFTSLHATAVAVAIYEWLSPFGLNPWGRQRSKNFGMASALWVMWGLLCGHLVQFKAPKSWPNKFLINVWGGFSVIFIASYTANIAALIAGLFFHNTVGDHHDRSLLTQRVGAPRASAAEYYVRTTNPMLWDHMQKFSVKSVGEGVQLLKNGSLDILIADTPVLDYYRATDHGCKLQRIGDTINEDTYGIGMSKGFPLKDSISAVIAKYASNGYIDILQEKWYGGLPCFKLATDMAQPRPLGVAAVAGVFLMLGLGVLIGCLILFSEHLFYRYTLPKLRRKPKTSIWKSRNVMFFSQKLYRFINCVELVSPHHAARELVHTLRQGQITSLFQKSVRRKEHEHRQQQQKSKAQFFEMIQEIRRVQQEERKDNVCTFNSNKISPRKKHYYSKNSQILLSPTGLLKNRNRLSPGRLDFARRLSKDVFRSKSSGNLDVRRMSSDINMAAGRFYDFYSAQAIGRRLSHGTGYHSPPDINTRRASQYFSPPLQLNESGDDDRQIKEEEQCLSTHTKSSSNDNRNPSELKSPSTPSTVSSSVLSPGRTHTSFFSRDIGPIAARKFSNIDKSSFRGVKTKAQNKLNTPKLTLNNEDITGCHANTGGQQHCSSSTSLTRTDSQNSTEHFIQILLPSDTGHCRNDSYPTNELPESCRPKIILHLPDKRQSSATGCQSGNSCVPESDCVSPLLRLTKEELQILSQLPDKELKDMLLKALEKKDPT